MSIPSIRCTYCGHEFSVQIMQEGSKQWLELDPDHDCPENQPILD